MEKIITDIQNLPIEIQREVEQMGVWFGYAIESARLIKVFTPYATLIKKYKK